MITYEDSGVSVTKGDQFVEGLKKFAVATHNNNVKAGIGGFCALYDPGDRYLASATDGVGTKLKLAMQLGIHHTIGQDLVAMCVNDIICAGARPLFFLDYLATGKLTPSIHLEVVRGISNACQDHQVVLIGGETAEMPGMYQAEEYDLAGFLVGEVAKDKVIDGKNIKKGDVIIGVESSGIHSNGFSLVRKLIASHETALLKEALTPTHIYSTMILDFIKKYPNQIKGMAHITGGGFANISRINPSAKYKLDGLPKLPALFAELQKRAALPIEEMHKTFNCGIGLAVVLEKAHCELFQAHSEQYSYKTHQIGRFL